MPHFRVILASASPRRAELLRRIVPDFEVKPADIDEKSLAAPEPEETAISVARAKAKVLADNNPSALVIAGDTVVAVPMNGGYAQLGKPESANDAAHMLRLLSGRTHFVTTGICFVLRGREQSFAVTTEVSFRNLSDQEIADYVATGEPMDKAGAYAIQGGASGFLTYMRGSLSNVIGLPLEELETRLAPILLQR